MAKLHEIWLPVTEFPQYFEVSNLGRVKIKERIVYVNGGEYLKPEALNTQWLDQDGYLRVTLCFSGKRIKRNVSRLVVTAFHPNPENKPQVNHKDHDRKNNHADNLEWCTSLENLLHSNTNKKYGVPVIQMDLDGNEVKVWPNLESIKGSGFQKGCVGFVCLKSRRTHAGFKWKYAY